MGGNWGSELLVGTVLPARRNVHDPGQRLDGVLEATHRDSDHRTRDGPVAPDCARVARWWCARSRKVPEC